MPRASGLAGGRTRGFPRPTRARQPDGAVDGAAILLEEIGDGRIDPEQAWFWMREWQAREREADEDLAAGRVKRYGSDEEFLAALDERATPLDADA